nr:DNA helicase [Tanacetum cinerariifolium]
MSDDIPRTTAKELHIPNLHINDPELEGFVLYELKTILNIYSKSVTDFGLPPLSERLLKQPRNKEMMEEKSYNGDELAAEVLTLIPKLNEEQQKIYNLIMDGSVANRQELIFVYVASSGIASLLLPSGHTAHSRFKIPLELTDESICGIKKNTRSQTLPVKKGASKPEIVASSIAESEIWHHFKVCTLRHNMRLMQPGKSEEEQNLTRVFADWLLDISNRNIGEQDTTDPQNSSWVHILEIYSIQDDNNDISKLISFIYDEHTLRNPTAQKLQQKAIVCHRNDTAESITNSKKGGRRNLQFSGFPPHELELKVGTPIMLLRNGNFQGGMCNGTWMIVKKMWSKLIEARVITETEWAKNQNQKGLPRDIPLDRIEVLQYDTKGVKVRKGIMQNKTELTLEQTQQGVSDEVLVSIEGVEE